MALSALVISDMIKMLLSPSCRGATSPSELYKRKMWDHAQPTILYVLQVTGNFADIGGYYFDMHK